MSTSPIGSLRDRLRSLHARVGAWTSRYEAWRFGEVDLTAKTGVKGEQYAARYLRKSGLRIIAAGESDFAGELDLVAIDIPRRWMIRRGSPEIVFVEVKTRSSGRFGIGSEAITPEKYRRLHHLARRWCKARGVIGDYRIDVISIDDLVLPTMRHLRRVIL